jgi:hypothetical protein
VKEPVARGLVDAGAAVGDGQHPLAAPDRDAREEIVSPNPPLRGCAEDASLDKHAFHF